MENRLHFAGSLPPGALIGHLQGRRDAVGREKNIVIGVFVLVVQFKSELVGRANGIR